MSTLLSKELKERLPKLREQEGVVDPIIHAKFMFPASGWVWYVTEGQPEHDDFTIFGYVIGFEAEWGYFTLRELKEVNIHDLVIEREESFEPCPLSIQIPQFRCG